jgi:hypothetical protein
VGGKHKTIVSAVHTRQSRHSGPCGRASEDVWGGSEVRVGEVVRWFTPKKNMTKKYHMPHEKSLPKFLSKILAT